MPSFLGVLRFRKPFATPLCGSYASNCFNCAVAQLLLAAQLRSRKELPISCVSSATKSVFIVCERERSHSAVRQSDCHSVCQIYLHRVLKGAGERWGMTGRRQAIKQFNQTNVLVRFGFRDGWFLSKRPQCAEVGLIMYDGCTSRVRIFIL